MVSKGQNSFANCFERLAGTLITRTDLDKQPDTKPFGISQNGVPVTARLARDQEKNTDSSAKERKEESDREPESFVYIYTPFGLTHSYKALSCLRTTFTSKAHSRNRLLIGGLLQFEKENNPLIQIYLL